MSKVCTHEWESVSKLLTGTVLIIHRFWGSYGSVSCEREIHFLFRLSKIHFLDTFRRATRDREIASLYCMCSTSNGCTCKFLSHDSYQDFNAPSNRHRFDLNTKRQRYRRPILQAQSL